jgi:hypothetical protein
MVSYSFADIERHLCNEKKAVHDGVKFYSVWEEFKKEFEASDCPAFTFGECTVCFRDREWVVHAYTMMDKDGNPIYMTHKMC